MCVCIYSIYVCVRAGAFDYGKAIDVIAIYVKTIINRLNCIERPRYRKETWTVSRSSSSNVVPRTTPFSTKLLRESMALKSAFEVDKKKRKERKVNSHCTATNEKQFTIISFSMTILNIKIYQVLVCFYLLFIYVNY